MVLLSWNYPLIEDKIFLYKAMSLVFISLGKVFLMLHLFCQNCNQLVDAEPLQEPLQDGIAICPVCGFLLPAQRYIAPQTVINGYQIQKEIGRGGMGVVYLARQLNLDRDVALKVLSDEMSSDQAFVEAFFREARAAASLNHPNIVQAYDAGAAENGIYYFAMELIDGKNLEVYTAEHGALDYKMAFKCATRIADALAYAWDNRKLAHRDIKPENIILMNNGEYKLADLGLAKDYREGNIESEDDLMATPAYASPEVIRGERDKIGFKSDMYSFGATLYQLFAGRPPFIGDDPMIICRKQLDEQPKPLLARKPELPSRLSILVDKLMEKVPEKRPDSWFDVLNELNEITTDWYATESQRIKATKQAKAIAPIRKLLGLNQPDGGNQSSKNNLLAIIVIVLLVLLGALTTLLCFILPQMRNNQHVVSKDKIKENTTSQTPFTPISTQQDPTPIKKQNSVTTTPTPVTPQKESISAPPPIVVQEPPKPPADPWRDFLAKVPEHPYKRWEFLKEKLESKAADIKPFADKIQKMIGDIESEVQPDYCSKLQDETDRLQELIDLNKIAQTSDVDELKKLQSDVAALVKMVEDAPVWACDIVDDRMLKIYKDRVRQLETYIPKLEEQLERSRENNTLVEQKQTDLKKKRLREKKQATKQAAFEKKKLIEDMNTEYVGLCQKVLTENDSAFEQLSQAWIDKFNSVMTDQNKTKIKQLKELKRYLSMNWKDIFSNSKKELKDSIPFPDIHPDGKVMDVTSANLVLMVSRERFRSKERHSWEELNRGKRKYIPDFIFNSSCLKKLDMESKKALILQALIELKISRSMLEKRVDNILSTEKNEIFKCADCYPESLCRK